MATQLRQYAPRAVGMLRTQGGVMTKIDKRETRVVTLTIDTEVYIAYVLEAKRRTAEQQSNVPFSHIMREILTKHAPRQAKA